MKLTSSMDVIALAIKDRPNTEWPKCTHNNDTTQLAAQYKMAISKELKKKKRVNYIHRWIKMNVFSGIRPIFKFQGFLS